MRLTEKNYCGYDIKDRECLKGYDNENDNERLFSALQKLGKLEDIEDELGIDLITLFKALFGGCVYAKTKKGILKVSVTRFTKSNLFGGNANQSWWDYEHGDGFYHAKLHYKDYGKTWALTKEELENGNLSNSDNLQ